MQESNIPPATFRLYEIINSELGWLRHKLDHYYELFVGEEDKHAFLDKIAPIFFGVCQKAYQESILVSICRIGDPRFQNKKQNENVTLETLVKSISSQEHSSLRERLDPLLEDYKRVTKNSRNIKNKLIGHLDRPTTEDKNNRDQLKFCAREFREALEIGQSIILNISKYFDEYEVSYDTTPLEGDVEDLIYHLKIYTESIKE